MIVMMTVTILPIGTFYRFHFWTDKLKSGYATPKMEGITFRLHGQGRIVRTTGNNGKVRVFKT